MFHWSILACESCNALELKRIKTTSMEKVTMVHDWITIQKFSCKGLQSVACVFHWRPKKPLYIFCIQVFHGKIPSCLMSYSWLLLFNLNPGFFFYLTTKSCCAKVHYVVHLGQPMQLDVLCSFDLGHMGEDICCCLLSFGLACWLYQGWIWGKCNAGFSCTIMNMKSELWWYCNNTDIPVWFLTWDWDK